jgi:lambda family phage portal protein
MSESIKSLVDRMPVTVITQKSIVEHHGARAIAVRPGGSSFPRLTAGRRGAGTKAYEAGITNRLTSDWCGISRLSADAELQGKLHVIRARSRDGEQNDPYMENFLRLKENNVVGPDGFTLQMKVKKSETINAETGEIEIAYEAAINREIERGWKRYCRRENYLVTKNMDAVAADRVICRTYNRDGSALIRKVRGYPLNEFQFALQLFEPDYLDNQAVEFRYVACSCPEQFGLQPCESGRHEVRMGVELQGDWKFPVAYWLLAQHPGDNFFGSSFSSRRIRVVVDDIIHPFVVKRIEQTEGIPAMVAAMLRLQMLGGYDEATLVSARAAAQKMGFLEKDIPDSIADQFADEWAEGQATINSSPGEIEELPMGVRFKSWDPTNPNDSYAPFIKTQLRGAACAGGVSYTSLANDIESVNYSSIRAGLLEERTGYRGEQKFFITEIKRQAFEAWLPMAILTGAVKVPMARLAEYTDDETAIFTGRGWDWVDPKNDVQSAEAAIAAGLSTRTIELAKRGLDFEEVNAELSREQKMRDAAGLKSPEEQSGRGQTDNA